MLRDFQNNKLINLLPPLAGIAGCMIVGGGIYESATHYIGSGFYSPENHFISELGLSTSTTMAHVFNRSLNIAGFLLMIFVIGLGRFLGNGYAARAGIVTGITATVSFSAVGYFTAADWLQHMIAASIFFAGAMLTVSFFVFAILHDTQKRLHRVHVLHGILIVACYFIALLWPKDLMWQMTNDPAHFVRPSIWAITLLEWGYCLLICTWICMVSLNLLYQSLLESRTVIFLTGKQLYREYNTRAHQAMTWINKNFRL
ncbi:MAG: DUF998 domain-containing protein [Chitinophagales bacterium]|mgnify:CR=1 FL=1|nr:DUF998 domain-containing protein [Chitinophagales bacterium]